MSHGAVPIGPFYRYLCRYRYRRRCVDIDVDIDIDGSFCKLGVVFVGALCNKSLLSGVHTRAPDCWKLPFDKLRTT